MHELAYWRVKRCFLKPVLWGKEARRKYCTLEIRFDAKADVTPNEVEHLVFEPGESAMSVDLTLPFAAHVEALVLTAGCNGAILAEIVGVANTVFQDTSRGAQRQGGS